MITRDTGFHDCLQVFPGIVVELAPDGTVLNSNGHLERLIGREIAGAPLASALDETSQEKLNSLLSSDPPMRSGDRLELILVTPDRFDVRTFLVQRSEPPDEPRIWLVEFVRDPELDRLHEELAAVNSDLVAAQRELTRERAQLARALAREKEARAMADAAVRVRNEVLGIVSHDLRNPIGAISASASVLLELQITEEQRERQLRLIKRAAQRAARLIEDLLDVSRIEAVGLELERTPVEVPPLVQEVHESFRAQAEEAGIELRYDTPDDLPRILADRDRILQVLANLVGNAIKFTPRGGHVGVRAAPSGDTVVFTVRDTGMGIPEDEIPHLFERFWQARRTQRTGAGLGLSIAKAIVEAHDSTLKVSTEVGVGSEFSFAIQSV